MRILLKQMGKNSKETPKTRRSDRARAPVLVSKRQQRTFPCFFTIFALLLVMCFQQCNIRANLIAVECKNPIDTLHDALTHSTKIWIAEVSTGMFV